MNARLSIAISVPSTLMLSSTPVLFTPWYHWLSARWESKCFENGHWLKKIILFSTCYFRNCSLEQTPKPLFTTWLKASLIRVGPVGILSQIGELPQTSFCQLGWVIRGLDQLHHTVVVPPRSKSSLLDPVKQRACNPSTLINENVGGHVFGRQGPEHKCRHAVGTKSHTCKALHTSVLVPKIL